MMRSFGIVMMLAGLLAAGGQAQFNPPGGGGGGPMGFPGGGPRGGGRDSEEMRARADALGALDLEGMWAVLSFGSGLGPGAADSLHAPFQAAWDRRASVLDGAEKNDREGWEAIADEFKSMRKDLDRTIRSLLGDSRYRTFADQMKAREKSRGRGPGHGPGSGGMDRPGN